MKKMIIAIAVVLAAIIAITTYFIVTTKTRSPDPAAYTVYVYDTGEAQIEVDSVNQIIQTHEDVVLDDMELKAGTIILPGNGDEIYYEYPRRDHVIN